MPIFDFECIKCSFTFEAIQRSGDNENDFSCPQCGEKQLRKLVSSFRTNSWSQFLDNMEKRVNPAKFK